MRQLTPNQTADLARGSFLVRPRMVKEYPDGRRIFVAPTEPVGSGEGYETFSNAVQFQPIKEKTK